MNRGTPSGCSIAFLALALSLSCGASSGEPRVPPDESLNPHQYEQLGIPHLATDWTSEDRTRARAVLRDLAEDRPEHLPRFASESSGVVFAKLIHEEFDRRSELEGELGSRPVGELERMEPDELAELIQGDTLEAIYAPESTGNLLFDRELVQFASQRLRKALALRSDLEENLAEVESSPTREQNFAARYHELLQFNDQVLVQLLGNITAFAVAERFTAAGRSDAVSHLVEQVPQIAPLLSPAAQANLRQIIADASTSSGADPRLLPLSHEW